MTTLLHSQEEFSYVPEAGTSKAGAAAAAMNGHGTNPVLDLLDELAPSPTRLAELMDSPTVSDAEKKRVVTGAYLTAASSGQSELLEWILGECRKHQGRYLDVEVVDEEGIPAVVLAAQYGHGECVRILVEAGVDINGRDSRGWTALMWALQAGNLPLSSFLINRRAATSIRSNNGLAAIDLVRKGSAGEVFRDVLRDFAENEAASSGPSSCSTSINSNDGRRTSVASPPTSPKLPRIPPKRQMSSMSSPPALQQSRLLGVAEKEHQLRTELAIESAHNLQLDFSLLDISSASIPAPREDHDELPSYLLPHGSEADEDEYQSFDWEECQVDQMISFNLPDLPAILDIATDIRPSQAKETRHLPADVVFLAARYAARFGGEDLLGELMIGAIDRIEASIHSHPEDLANCSFWLSNTLLLLYYLRKDPQTADLTLEYQDNLHDLIREIFIFCLRDTERRLDRILDASMLEHEALPGFDDIRFEGEWRFVKALTSRGKKEGYAAVNSSTRATVMSLFGSPDKSVEPAVPSHMQTPNGSQQASPNKLVSARSRTPSMPILRRDSQSVHSRQGTPAQMAIQEMSPRTVTGILSSTLFVLQHYEFAGHPCIVVQAFSQLLYWMASELFNRILSKKRYLCRSRAIQIRLNVSSLEDWARTNRLPTTMVTEHFRPLNELLQWLQCLSSETSIDGLLSTTQNLKTLNPTQMRKAVKEYRYEVEETKMSEECAQYLAQLQKDWERRQLLQNIEEAEREAERSTSSSLRSSLSSLHSESSISLHSNESSRSSDLRTSFERHIDAVFGSADGKLHAYEPPQRPDCSGELLDSRIMLPFALPTVNEALVTFARESFGPLHKPRPTEGRVYRDSVSSVQSTPIIRSSSKMSNITNNILADLEEHEDPSLPEPSLPLNFLALLDAAKSRYCSNYLSIMDGSMLYAPPDRSSSHGRDLSASTAGQLQDDHWVNWRERMARELAEAEAEDTDDASAQADRIAITVG